MLPDEPAVIVIWNTCVAVAGPPAPVAESCTCTVKVEVPKRIGIPEIRPVLASKVKPAGSWPFITLHVNGGTPPVAFTLVL